MADYAGVLHDALELSEDEREMLVCRLTASIDGETDDWLSDNEFLSEMRRRSDEARKHPENLVQWETVREELFGDSTGP